MISLSLTFATNKILTFTRYFVEISNWITTKTLNSILSAVENRGLHDTVYLKSQNRSFQRFLHAELFNDKYTECGISNGCATRVMTLRETFYKFLFFDWQELLCLILSPLFSPFPKIKSRRISRKKQNILEKVKEKINYTYRGQKISKMNKYFSRRIRLVLVISMSQYSNRRHTRELTRNII